MITVSDVERAEVDRVTRHFSAETQEATIRDITATWSVNQLAYALEVVGQRPTTERLVSVPLYRQLLSEASERAARAALDAANARRHADLKGEIASLKKPHWTVLPNFWITLVSLFAAVVAAVAAVIAASK